VVIIDIISEEYAPYDDKILEEANLKENSLQLKNKKILVVEDSDDSRDLLCQLLEHAGADVTTAKNGKEGLDKAVTSRPDLLLLDLEMPVMDGYSVIRELRDRKFRNPILAITAHNTLFDRDRCSEAGFDGHISKPFDPERLLVVLKEHLGSA
jgi:CheY-like chemotaxis protein